VKAVKCVHPTGQQVETCPECFVESQIRRQGGELVALEMMRHLAEALTAFDRHLEQMTKAKNVKACEVAAFNGYIQGLEHALSIARGEDPWTSQSPRLV
jgi:hypothetical protein